jgi:hypothetical protein
LLNPLEEQLNLPSCFVNIRYRFGRQLKIIGKEGISFTRQCVFIANPTHFDGAFFSRLNARKFNYLVANQPCFFVNTSTFNDPVFSIAFQTSDKKYPLVYQLFIPRIVVIALINLIALKKGLHRADRACHYLCAKD